jgi:hypothetical protein
MSGDEGGFTWFPVTAHSKAHRGFVDSNPGPDMDVYQRCPVTKEALRKMD